MSRESNNYDNSIINRNSESIQHLIDLFVYKGRPRNLDPEREIQILVNHGYVVGFSPNRNQPAWTAYRVAKSQKDLNYARPHLFYDDHRLAANNQIGYETFGGGYDRGHMVPNFAINTQFGRLAQMETFFMSNISPQKADLNQGLWKRLEGKIATDYSQEWEHVWVLTGPVFGKNPERIKRRENVFVDIPDSFFCILVDPLNYPHDKMSNVSVIAMNIPQEVARTENVDKHHITTINDIENLTQLNLFPTMTARERNSYERMKAQDIWDNRRVYKRGRRYYEKWV